jgi:hypothetical protein
MSIDICKFQEIYLFFLHITVKCHKADCEIATIVKKLQLFSPLQSTAFTVAGAQTAARLCTTQF